MLRSWPARWRPAGAISAAAARPAAIAADAGELVYVGRDPVRIKISPGGTGGRFAMITQDVSPGTTIPIHLHEKEDEVIFIQSGAGEATLGDETIALGGRLDVVRPAGHLAWRTKHRQHDAEMDCAVLAVRLRGLLPGNWPSNPRRSAATPHKRGERRTRSAIRHQVPRLGFDATVTRTNLETRTPSLSGSARAGEPSPLHDCGPRRDSCDARRGSR